MANQVDIVKSLVEASTHNFTEAELTRFCGETASEVGRACKDGSFVDLVKSAKLTTKGITFGLESVKLNKDAVTLRGITFLAMLQVASLNKKSFAAVAFKLDITDACDKLRDAWKRKDGMAQTAAQPNATPESASESTSPEPEPAHA